jgi:hypothetical protein
LLSAEGKKVIFELSKFERFQWDQKAVSERFLLKDSILKDSGLDENIF